MTASAYRWLRGDLRHEGTERTRHLGRWFTVAALGALLLLAVVQFSAWPVPWLAWDSRAYWDATHALDPYATARVGALGAYLYSPAFLQLIGPAGGLPWPVFVWLWAFAGIAVAIGLGSRLEGYPRWALVCLALLATAEVWAGNVNLFLAAAIVLGFRWPAAWSFVILTKVTPGLGLLWFVFRGEWRRLAIALGATLAIVLVSAALVPHLWSEWLSVLSSNAGARAYAGEVAIPAVIRFPAAILLLAWGARDDRRWVVPVACVLLLPIIWPNGLAILVGCAALLDSAPSALAWARRGRPSNPAHSGIA
jgi:hypothetical protein